MGEAFVGLLDCKRMRATLFPIGKASPGLAMPDILALPTHFVALSQRMTYILASTVEETDYNDLRFYGGAYDHNGPFP